MRLTDTRFFFYPDDVSVNEPEKSDKDTAVILEDEERDMAKRQIPIEEVWNHNLAQTKDCLKDYIDVLKNEPDARSFKKITDEMLDTYKAKNHDYGNSFSNLFKECGMTYAYGHMAEKLERVKSLMKDEAKVKGEGMKDSLKDLANYAILTIMELERKEEK